MAVPIVFFIASAIIIITFMYLYFSTRHKERMSLIESGRDAGIFNENRKRQSGSNALKFGLFLVFIGLGVLVGVFMESTFNIPDASGVIPSILISGGLALLLYYRIMKREEDDLEETRRYSSTRADVHDVV